MSDPFTRSHEASRRREAREQAEADKKAADEVTKQRMAKTAADAKANPNRDIGTPWPKKFYNTLEG